MTLCVLCVSVVFLHFGKSLIFATNVASINILYINAFHTPFYSIFATIGGLIPFRNILKMGIPSESGAVPAAVIPMLIKLSIVF